MTDNVTPLRTCKCGAPGAPLSIEGDGRTIRGFACDACLAKVDATLAQVRPVFHTMLACGVPKDLANATMAYLLEQIDP